MIKVCEIFGKVFGFAHVSLISMAYYYIYSGVYRDISVVVLCQTT